MPDLVLGVDGGNSKTLAVVADATGRTLGVGRTGSSSHQAVGIDAAMAAIQEAVDMATGSAGLDPRDLSAAYFALAGADLPEDYALLRSALTPLSIGRVWEVENDVFAALRSGTEAADAAVVILGAGCNAAGRNASGEIARFPALGWISGDWGGAEDVVREAIRLTVRAWDGRGQPTVMTEMLPEALGASDVDGMVRALYHGTRPPAGLLSLAPLVFHAAESGDDIARSIVRRQGREAAIMAVTILSRLRLLDRRPDVVLAGGLTRAQSRVLLDAVADGITTAAPDARILLPDLEPVAGAVLLALDLAGLTVTAETRANLQHSFSQSMATG